MNKSQQPFPIDVRTGWVDYSPALRHHTTQRVRSRLAELAPQIRSVAARISDAEPHQSTHRRCHIEVTTTDAGLISASTVGVDLFAIVDRTVDTVAVMLRQRLTAVADGEMRQRIA